MNESWQKLKSEIFDKCNIKVTDFVSEPESQEYAACQFKINKKTAVFRKAKNTPKKVGQFVTFWKRNFQKIIEPFSETNKIDLLIVTVQSENQWGLFVFPKNELILQGIIATKLKKGKLGFRVYPRWDIVNSKQAERTQAWQSKYFYQIDKATNLNKVKGLLEF